MRKPLENNPEDIIRERGATKKVFRELYAGNRDPWFGNVSNAEKVRMDLTMATVRKYVDEGDTVLDFGCGNRTLTNKLPGFVTGVDLAFDNDASISRAFLRIYDCVCSFNVLYYYDRDEWSKMLWDFYMSICGRGHCIIGIPISGVLSIDLSAFRHEFSKLFELVEERTVAIDWHEDLEYRESLHYFDDLTRSLGEPTQTLLVGRKT